MPFLVKVAEGNDPRELAENLADDDARKLAVNVSQETGEDVTLVPYVWDEKSQSYKLDEANSQIVRTAAAEVPGAEGDGADGPITVEQLDAMKGPELDALAEKMNVEGYKKSAKVDERRAAIAAALPSA